MTRSLPFKSEWLWRSVWLLCLLVPSLVCASDAPSGEGEPFMQYFSPRDYQGEVQCWCFAQDNRRVMYVGNVGAVLEYDGSTWRKVSIHQSSLVSALASDPSQDTVFVGARGDLGYLKLLPDGEREYVSLLNELPAALRDVGFVSRVYCVPGGTYFVGATQVMRWRDGQFKVWPLETEGRLTSEWAEGHLYVHNPRTGLLRLEEDTFVLASDDPLFRRTSVRAILPMADGTLLVGTYHDGAYTLRRDGMTTPWQGECNDFLKSKGLYRMLRLRDDSLAIATDTAGLLLLDREGHFRNRVDGTGGLHGSNLLNLYQDAEDGLWIGLENGCTRAEVCSPLTILRAGPEDSLGGGAEVGSWFGSAVLGNTNSLYQVVPAAPAAFSGPRLRRLPEITDSFTSLCAVENGLLTVGTGKVALLDADARLIPVQGEITAARNVFTSRVFPGRVYVTDEGGHVTTLRLDPNTSKWTVDKVVASLGKPGEMTIDESANGNLWLGTKEHGLFRVRWGGDGTAVVTSFLEQPGPLHGESFVLSHSRGGPIRFHTHNRVYRLDDAGQDVLPVEDYGPLIGNGAFLFVNATQFDGDHLWFVGRETGDVTGEVVSGEATVGGPGRAPMVRALPHKVEDVVGVTDGFLLTDDTVPPATLLLPDTTGNCVVRLDVRRWERQPEARPFETVVRRATTIGSLRMGRQRSPILHEPLTYQQNSVHFELAANTLAFGATPRFQTRLVNFGTGEWSDFSNRTETDYVNLPEGVYIFEARACDADGHLGGVASFPFRVLPPWQRTPWAYAAYLAVLALAFGGLVRWRGRQLQRRNAVLSAVVDARTSELLRARNEAEAANHAKSAFLANMSHELRTPLNAILGYSQIMLKQAELPLRTREQATIIRQSGSHLLTLINEVLDLSKIEAGKLSLVPVDFILSAVLDEVSATFRPRIAEKKLVFTENRYPGLPFKVHSDPDRLRQVLINLLGNAVKFTHEGGVTLVVQPADAQNVRFEVIDTGIGIAEGELRDIFLAFHQVRDSKLAVQGTGLGLPISQRLVGLFGGRINVESSPGQGSRFWFEIPLPALDAVDGLPARNLAGQMKAEVTGYEGPRRRLLLVDDLTENRRVLRAFLQPLGFVIEEAADGEQCLATCESRLPDAVLLDLRLGVMDGFKVAQTLRVRTKGLPLGIIAISASAFESDRQCALEAGCDAFLPKPLDEAQLFAALTQILGLQWVQVERSVSRFFPGVPPMDEGGILTSEDAALLLNLSLRGDVRGLRNWLDALPRDGLPSGVATFARCLEPLVAKYDMDGIHKLILESSSEMAL